MVSSFASAYLKHEIKKWFFNLLRLYIRKSDYNIECIEFIKFILTVFKE